MADNSTFAAALAPYLETPTQYNPAFSSGPAFGLIRSYLTAYRLNLTDAEIAVGIARFGQWHRAQFGSGISAWSSQVAVAAQSVEEAISAKAGVSPYSSPFWKSVEASGDLARGDAAALTAGQMGYRSYSSYGESSWFDNLVFTAVPLVMGAIVAPAILGELAAAGTFGAEALTGELAAADAAAGLLPEFGTLATPALTAPASAAADLAAADAAAGLSPDFGTLAPLETTTTGANTVSLSLEDSIGNFGDWIGTDSGTMYNPQTGEYLTPDGYYDAGSLGNIAPGGSDAYYSSAASFANSGASLSTSLNDIFGKVSQVLKSAGSALAGAQQITANNKVQPNLNRNIGQTNLALPLLAAAAWFAFKG